MAGILAHVNSGEVSLVAATAKTVLQVVAASNHRILVKGVSVMLKGTTSTDTPVRVRILRQTNAGTMSSATPVKNSDSDDETLQTTAQYNASAEPTAGDVLSMLEVHPQTGIVFFYPPGMEPVVKGGARLGVECLAAQNQTVAVTLTFEE